MVKKAFFGAAAGSIVLMVWGFVYWTVLPFGYRVMDGVGSNTSVVRLMQQTLPGTGVYMIPWLAQDEMQQGDAVEKMVSQHREGPVVQILYSEHGADPMGPQVLLGGLMNFFTVSLIVAGLLLMAMPGLRGYSERVQFVFLLGLLVGVSDLARPIWWHQPWDYWIHQALFPMTGWLLAGLVMGWIIKPGAAEPPAEQAQA